VVGAFVGAFVVGVFVGAFVVGAFVGAFVGTRVGAFVFDPVGAPVMFGTQPHSRFQYRFVFPLIHLVLVTPASNLNCKNKQVR
jgi:hypothetical protein